MYCNTTAVLKVDLVSKEGKNYDPQVHVKELHCCRKIAMQHAE